MGGQARTWLVAAILVACWGISLICLGVPVGPVLVACAIPLALRGLWLMRHHAGDAAADVAAPTAAAEAADAADASVSAKDSAQAPAAPHQQVDKEQAKAQPLSSRAQAGEDATLPPTAEATSAGEEVAPTGEEHVTEAEAEQEAPQKAEPGEEETDGAIEPPSREIEAGETLGPQVEHLSPERLLWRLCTTATPLKVLSRTCERIREGVRAGTAAGWERFLLRVVEDSGALEESDDLAHVTLTVLTRSQLIYLKGLPPTLPFGTYLKAISLEAGLNALALAWRSGVDLEHTDEREFWRRWQREPVAVLYQAPAVDTADWSYLAMPWQTPLTPSAHGEWSLRHSLSEALESAHFPWRLQVRFRANAASGDVALEFDATPAACLPRTAYVDGIGLVPTTAPMRRREASRYAARVGLLLASFAFAADTGVRRVWVNARESDPKHAHYLFSACLERRAFSRLNLHRLPDPIGALASLGAELSLEADALTPIRPRFQLEDRIFCPPERHDLMELSERRLDPMAAHSLGTERVSGLSIHEELPRSLAADDVCRRICGTEAGQSASSSVEAVLDVAHTSSDLTVWDAAERVARHIVEGTLETADPEAVRHDMVEGDALTRALETAQARLLEGDAEEAIRTLEAVLAPFERQGTYADTEAVCWRCFDSFAERVIYNRLSRGDDRCVALVPDAYLIAHLTLASLYLQMSAAPHAPRDSFVERALDHAERSLAVAPHNTPAHLLEASCLEVLGLDERATAHLARYLEHAYHPQGIALAYLDLAHIFGRAQVAEAMHACYQMAIRTMPQLMPLVLAELHQLAEHGVSASEMMGPEQLAQVLEAHDIPLAPTDETAYYLFDGASASIDAEVFPVARDLMSYLEILTGDDVIHLIATSLEREPDR